MPKAFDENTCVPLDLVKPLVVPVKSFFNSHKPLANSIKALIEPTKTLIEVPNQSWSMASPKDEE